MISICEKKISAEMRLIHAEQTSLHNFIVLRKKQWTQLKTKQIKEDILNQWESMGFTDHLKHKIVNKEACRMPSANPRQQCAH